ncbi:flippase-like domain-containing protein [Nocardiopsis sp. EMB25]|uniref:lysylphosphatidylglycerol synthase transmembrane domain-containing protein n=1 Tax=Nocardiopsis sp. EMB25 TaxID=2835867 RepID=UPI002284FCBB|nr:lysylphosphatidylglycerol synthase transmembrane domain-containing protein [Nocardiopsis sp. EMB25]MCY9783323.1 flippase-like domain-containing protein [Nocardiopsis sp. EMB25]
MLLAVRVLSDGEPVTGPAQLRALLPLGLLLLVAVGANLLLIVLVCFVVLRTLLQGRLRDLVRAVTAAVSAYALASLINALLAALLGSRQVLDTLTGTPGDVFTNATLGYVAAAIAFVRTMPSGQPRVRALLWTGVALVAVCALLALVTSVLALVMTVLVGLVCAALARYAVGAGPAPRADGRIHAEMHRFGMTTTDISQAGTDDEGNPRHVADLDDGTRVEVAVMSSENTTGFWWRLRDLLLLRGPVAPRMLYGVRRRAEHAALMSFCAREAGVTVPRVRAVGEVGPGTVLLARELLPVRTLDALDEADLTDDLLDRCWSVLGALHHRRVAHGNLSPATVGILDDDSATVALTGVDRGAVAAPQLRISLDAAAMVTLLALRVGAERAVASAVRALGVPATARVLPLLQAAGLPYPLRARLRSRPDLLSDLRARIVEVAPEAPAAPARLERMRPRTIVSVIVATAVGLVLAYQLAGVDLRGIGDADPGWTVAAFAMATLCMVAAAMVLIGFVPIPLPWWRTVMVQYAGSFVRIAAPAGLGSIAINSRFVVKAGAPAPLALSAVGLTQLVGFLVHVPLLLVCAYLTGTSYWTGFTPSPTVIGVSVAGTATVAAVLLLPGLRRRVAERVGPYLRGVLPRLLDTLQRPASLALGLGGTVLLTVAFVLCLHFSVLAFAGPDTGVSLVAVAVVFLAGNAIGSAAPTPGGLGAVEAALIGGLTTVVGVPAAVSLPAVLLFRVLTFWFPVLPGWGAFSYLQRREAV